MNKTWHRMWLPTAGMFILLCILVWVDEVLDLPHHLLGVPRTPINWREAVVEMVMIFIVGLLQQLFVATHNFVILLFPLRSSTASAEPDAE